MSIIRNLPAAGFDMLAGLLLDRDYRVMRAALIPHAVVVGRSSFIKHINGWRMMLIDDVWSEPSVRDITSALVKAAT